MLTGEVLEEGEGDGDGVPAPGLTRPHAARINTKHAISAPTNLDLIEVTLPQKDVPRVIDDANSRWSRDEWDLQQAFEALDAPRSGVKLPRGQIPPFPPP